MNASRKLKVNVEPDCGNAPRKAQVRDWLIALAEGDVDTVCDELDDEACWDIAGKQQHEGIDEIRNYVEQVADEQVDELSIRHLLSHGTFSAMASRSPPRGPARRRASPT